MRLLLDTHALLWFLDNNSKLSYNAKTAIENLENQVFVSMATWFEISIKLSIGKLTLPDSLTKTISKLTSNSMLTVEIPHPHLIQYQKLPPLDENCKLVSAVPKFNSYRQVIDLYW